MPATRKVVGLAHGFTGTKKRLNESSLSEIKKEKTQVDCEMENKYNALCDINVT